MPFNGSGVFTRVYNWVSDAAASIKIRADRMDTEMDGFATGLSNCVTKDGQTTITANLPLNNFRFTGASDATARNQFLTLAQAADGRPGFCATVGGTANAITLTNTVAYTTYVTGMTHTFIATAANTGSVTVNVDGLGARSIRKRSGANLISDDIRIGQPVTIVYDGTNYQLTSGQYSMTATDLATNAVTTPKITDANVTTAKLADKAVTLAKMDDLAAGTMLARLPGSGTGAPVAATLTAAGYALLDDADAAAQRATLGVNDLIVDRAFTSDATYRGSLTTVIPFDDTIPQNTEGTEIMSVSITPKTTTNRIRVRAQAWVYMNSTGHAVMSLFSGGASAIKTNALALQATYTGIVYLEHEFVPGSTSPITFSIRVGPTTGAMQLNGIGNRLFGGSSAATLIVEEIRA